MGKILVTGGCGYIGSHTIIDLLEQGYEVLSVDNLVNSTEDSLDRVKKITGTRPHNYTVDLSIDEGIDEIFKEHDIIGIIHFAALKAVGESTEKPLLYFKNNLDSLLNILKYAYKYKVPNLLFSSSCTVYGNAKDLPVTETTPLQKPESPYGHTKRMSEIIIEELYQRKGGRFVVLRYFNPAGAHPSYLLGEAPSKPALNLIPIITETAIGKRDVMHVYGKDYNTRDGTCVRDYIHIMDLARAHTLAFKFLLKETSCHQVFNLGIGEGVTVLEAIKAFEKLTGKPLNYVLGERRPGDVEAIYANYSKAKNKLDWQPAYTIEDIVETAWEWEKERSK